MEKQDQFSNWYKEQFNKFNELPPDDIWENISNELDVRDVWSNIDAKFNSNERKRKILIRSLCLIPMLFLFIKLGDLSSSIAYDSLLLNTTNNILAFQNENNKESIVSNGLNLKESIKNQIDSDNNRFNKNLSNNSKSLNRHPKKNITKIISNTLVSNINRTPDLTTNNQIDTPINDSSLSLIQPITSYLSSFYPNDLIQLNIKDPQLTIDSSVSLKPINKFNGFYAGGLFSISNIWLLNDLTLDGMKGNSLNDSKIKMGYSYGISLGYNFHHSWGAELNYYINSQQGQSYNLYNEGRYVNRQIKLNYSIVNLSLKHRNQGYNFFLKAPSSKNLIVGFNIGVLKNGENKSVSNINSQSENINTNFSTMDYGIRIGYEYEILAFKKLLISTALIGDIGLKNIYYGYSNLPGKYDDTHTTSIGCNIGVKYLIK